MNFCAAVSIITLCCVPDDLPSSLQLRYHQATAHAAMGRWLVDHSPPGGDGLPQLPGLVWRLGPACLVLGPQFIGLVVRNDHYTHTHSQTWHWYNTCCELNAY